MKINFKFLKNKKGVSLMVSYSILVVIALSLSVFVYSYLKLYTPSERPECSPDIHLAIQNQICIRDHGTSTTDKVIFQVNNRGLFSIPVIYSRFAEEGKTVRKQFRPGEEILVKPLRPGEILYNEFEPPSDIDVDGPYVIEVQPGIIEKGAAYPCDLAVVTQKVECIRHTTETHCSNGFDEDGDGDTDCSDTEDCENDPACLLDDTSWGKGPSGCTSSNTRWYNKKCVTCEGEMDSGGNYCLYLGGYGQNCDQVCNDHGGTYFSTCNWINLPKNCNIHYDIDEADCASCSESRYGPYFYEDHKECSYYDGEVRNDCTWLQGDVERICACNT